MTDGSLSVIWRQAKWHVLPFEHETLQSRNMNFHIRGILTLWLGFTWSGILAVRSAVLHTGPAGVVSCHGSGPEPYTWQVSTLSPPADNAHKGCVAAGQPCISSCSSTWKRTLVWRKLILLIMLIFTAIIDCFDTRLFIWGLAAVSQVLIISCSSPPSSQKWQIRTAMERGQILFFYCLTFQTLLFFDKLLLAFKVDIKQSS